MATELADISETEFARRLTSASETELDLAAVGRMYLHYRELRRWSRRFALVGSGMVEGVVERLFAESAAALELMDESVERVVDVGSGAGFPGLVLAAARPDLQVVLVEPRARKWAFLRAAAERASLSCVCLNARVTGVLPAGIPDRVDRVTVRALRLGPTEMNALAERLTEKGSFLSWSSDGRVPSGFESAGSVDLSEGRGRIVELRPKKALG